MKRLIAALAAVLLTAQAPALSPAERIYAQLARMEPSARAKALEDGARREGSVVIVHTYRGKEARDHIALFEKRYPWLHVDETDIGSQDAAERLLAEETAGRHLTDVVNLAIPDLTALIAANVLARYPTPATKAILDQYRRFIDPQHRWTPWEFSEHGISYNTKLVSPDKAPRAWSDLCKPAFHGAVSYDPGETRFLTGLYTMLGDAGAERLIKCIGENKPLIQRGHIQRMELMLAGDHMVQGDNYLFLGADAKRKNPSTPFAIVYSAPILAWADAMVINRNAPHPYAAALFTDWALSQESQDYVAGLLRGPLTEKHPFLPEDTRLVEFNMVPQAEVDRLQGYWSKYVGKGQ
jgi:iron(III) transport system substrate-binding protein